MLTYQVPRRRVQARILVDDGRTLEGELFTALSSPEGGPQRVVDRLNEPTEEFVPVARGEDRFLLNKSGIVTVELTDPVEWEGLDPEAGRQVPVRVTLTGGLALVGRFHILMPPDQSRVMDFLNHVPRFVPLLGEGKVTLLHRSHIVTVRSES